MSVTPEQIDAILPQTQCGLCTYGGCMPYAKALVHDNAAINLCPPGGVVGMQKIGALVGKDPAPFISDMREKEKPPMVAVIREAECIGCAKCIKACPVDAILGSGKQMHTVIADQCSGCELCIAPCPVDCIDLVTLPDISEQEQQEKASQYRARYYAREARLNSDKFAKSTTIASRKESIASSSLEDKKSFIQAALERAKLKK